jgi:hypothetical protein
MSQDLAIAPQAAADTPPSRQAIQAQTASRPLRVTGKLAIACKRIVWEGEELDIAAKAAGLTTRTLRLALERPHVISWIRAQREVFRAHVSAQNIHRAKKMRDESDNQMAALGAMKLIEQIGDQSAPGAQQPASPGLVIVVMGNAAQPSTDPKVIEHD